MKVYIVIFIIFLKLLFLNSSSSSAEEGISGDIFGKKGGYIHPFLSVNEYYSDNIFYSTDDIKGELFTTISPGILIALPGKKIDTPGISILDITSPGGRVLKGISPVDIPRRFQTGVLYSSEIVKHSEYKTDDYTKHHVEGMFHYNLKGGLSFKLSQTYEDSYDSRKISTEFEKPPNFNVLFTDIVIFYNIRNKFKLRMDYTDFSLNYDIISNHFKNRSDDLFSFYLFYNIFPKTYFFSQFNYFNIEYDLNSRIDSTEHNYYFGLTWKFSEKSEGTVRAGIGVKSFSEILGEKTNDLIFEGQITHYFSEKLSVKFISYRGYSETDSVYNDFILVDNNSLWLIYYFNERFSETIRISYIKKMYNGLSLFERKDKEYTASFSLDYILNGWLKINMEYFFERRDTDIQSDFDNSNDYISNSFLVGLQICI